MRRSRHKLQVSTFPFLAVLLGAMGSLIFLLLIMDYRAKLVARNKARDASARRDGEKARKEAERMTAWLAAQEAERAAQRERDELLAAAMRNLQRDRAALDPMLAEGQAALAQQEAEARRLAAEKDALGRWLADAKVRLDEGRRARTLSREQEAAAERKLAAMAADLARMEKIVADLKARKPAEVFSLVPYRGKHGERRRPIYVECQAAGLVFQPMGRSLALDGLRPERLRAEIETLGLKLAPKEEPLPGAPPRAIADTPGAGPYVLCIVRPDGIESYERLASALVGYDVDFGYELVDADWKLDYGADPAREAIDPPNVASRRPATGPLLNMVSRPGGDGQEASTTGFGPVRMAASGSAEHEWGGFADGAKSPPTAQGPLAALRLGLEGGAATILPRPRSPSRKASGAASGPIDGLDEPGRPSPGPAADLAWKSSAKNPRRGEDGPTGDPGSDSGSPGMRDPLAKAVRPPALGHVLGNREFVITLACTEEEVILTNIGKAFSLDGERAETAGRQLAQAVQDLISRRQASLRSGEPAYRPVIRFQVYPGGLRSYYRAYPLLETLRVPMKRENVEGP